MRNIAGEREKDTHYALFINSAIKRKKGVLFTDILREATVYEILMKKNLNIVTTVFVIILASIALYSCSSGRYLRTESAKAGETTGAYNLILYGGNYSNDIKTLAVLVREGEPYSFEIFAPAFDYRIVKGVPAEEAFKRAEKFVSFHREFWKAQLRKIIDNNGNTIGYEIRPLYYPVTSIESNPINVYYRRTDDKVIVYIRLSPQVEYMPFEGSGQATDSK